jgi:hypothetical protein
MRCIRMDIEFIEVQKNKKPFFIQITNDHHQWPFFVKNVKQVKTNGS